VDKDITAQLFSTGEFETMSEDVDEEVCESVCLCGGVGHTHVHTCTHTHSLPQYLFLSHTHTHTLTGAFHRDAPAICL
jgi:hypothetical protein